MSIKFRKPWVKVDDEIQVETIIDENGNYVKKEESFMKRNGKKVAIGAGLGLAALIGGICLAKRRKRNEEEDVDCVDDDYDFDDDYEPEEDQVDNSEEDYNETTD